MKMRLIKPDFKNNIINISATLAEFLGCPNDKPTLNELAKELQKGYKNVVFLILDGMGINPMRQNLTDDCFFMRNMKRTLTSVFPSTTTNATTTFLTNRYPMEHGWFGWSLYFEDLKKAVDIYLERDSFTGEAIEKGYVKKALPKEPYYKRANTDYTTSVVVPPFWHEDEENRYAFQTFDEMFSHIEKLCQKEGKQFIYTYCDEPDATMHRYGVSSEEAHRVINRLNDGVEALSEKLKDTLLIITADHGQIDVDGYIEIYKDNELMSMLEWPQFLEARATAFKVKPECHEAFVEMFRQKYGKDFALFKVEDFIKDNYFGGNIVNEHAKMLGDYIAVGVTHKIMQLTPLSHDFKGHHTSLTEEMEVPLIVVGHRDC